jgi:phosphatidylinositol-3-phosphatase
MTYSKSTRLTILIFFLLIRTVTAVIPRPDHIVICMLENHGYPQIIDSTVAPFIYNLAVTGADLQQFYAITHPSQPNYILLFSGYNQGEVTDNYPPLTPWQTPNLGASLIQQGYTFKGYSEDLPAVGSTAFYSGAYARKHSPWVNWQGTGPNQIPDSMNVPFSMFPTDFTQLPDVSFVIPNQDNDMHNGVDPDRILIGDNWVRDSLGPYITWAQTHNSLFILTFDEDNDGYRNRIPCIFSGPMIRPGAYALIYTDV